jgi:hypothetical protein
LDLNVEGDDQAEGPEEPELEAGHGSVTTPPPDHQVTRMAPKDVVQAEFCITDVSTILELLFRQHGDNCTTCDQQLYYISSFVGTGLVINCKCAAGHFGGRWASQPTCANLRVGNLLLASAFALSGNSFTKIGFLFKVINTKFISKNLFNQYQHLFIAPVIEKYWEDMKQDLWKEREGKETILSSDGRNDSPGHCAQYFTYSFADMESQFILQMNIVDVREVEGRKSNNMEIMAFEKGMGDLLRSSMVIKQIVTDSHLGSIALMSEW